MIKCILGGYRDEIEEIVRLHSTVNFEYTSPLRHDQKLSIDGRGSHYLYFTQSDPFKQK